METTVVQADGANKCTLNDNHVHVSTPTSNGIVTEQQQKTGKKKKGNMCANYTIRQWTIFPIFCAICGCAGVTYSLQAPFYPKLARDKGVQASVYGMVFGIFELVNFIACPFYGKNIRKFGAKCLMQTGTIVMAICCILFGFLDKAPAGAAFISLSFIIRIVEALGQSACITAVYASISQEFPETVATTFSVLETVYGVGMILGPAAGGAIYEVGGFLAPFAVIGSILMALSFSTFFLFPKLETGKPAGSVWQLLKIPAIAICYYAVAAISFSFGFTQALLEPHIQQFALSSSMGGLLFVVNGGTYALSAVAWGFAADKGVNPKLMCGLGAVFVIISFTFIGPFPFIPIKQELWLLIVSLAIHGIGGGGEYVSSFVDASREALANGFPDSIETYGIISGLYVSGLALGCFLGPFVSGILYDNIGFGYTALVVAILHVIVIILSYVSYRHSSRTSNKQQDSALELPEKAVFLEKSEDATTPAAIV